jgi:hypothetical protein
MVMRPSFYQDVGLPLWKADIAVVVSDWRARDRRRRGLDP